jgi:hypothetical protein
MAMLLSLCSCGAAAAETSDASPADASSVLDGSIEDDGGGTRDSGIPDRGGETSVPCEADCGSTTTRDATACTSAVPAPAANGCGTQDGIDVGLTTHSLIATCDQGVCKTHVNPDGGGCQPVGVGCFSSSDCCNSEHCESHGGPLGECCYDDGGCP